MITQSGGHSSHMMASSVTQMSLMPSNKLQKRGSRLVGRRLVQAISIKRMINSRRRRTRIKQDSSWSWHDGRFMYGSTSSSCTDQPAAAHHDHFYIHLKYFCQSLDRFLCCCQSSSSSTFVFFWLYQEDCASY